MPIERQIKHRVTCANCKKLIGDSQCQDQENATSREFSRVYMECGSKYPSSSQKVTRFCQHYDEVVLS